MDPRRTSKPIGQVPATVKAPVYSGNPAIVAAPGNKPKIAVSARTVPLPQVVKRPALVQEPAFTISSPDEPTKSSESEKKNEKRAKADIPQGPLAHTVRSAAGQVWQDPTLADWDPSNPTWPID